MTHEKPYPHSIIEQVQDACTRMMALLAEENTALQEKNISCVQTLTEEKNNLSGQIETMLADVRSWAASASDEARQELKTQMAAADQQMAEMNTLAQKNLALLEANHTATRTFLDVVRQAVNKDTPKAETYGKEGRLEQDKNSPSLMVRSV